MRAESDRRIAPCARALDPSARAKFLDKILCGMKKYNIYNYINVYLLNSIDLRTVGEFSFHTFRVF
jgi:hypothetical protein